ncbi:MAG: sulfatase-like hydrolase/transferase [Salinibacter sp.]
MRRNHAGPGLIILTLALMMMGCTSDEAPPEDRPNIILIMADDVGYEAFGAYGSEQYETPRIDSLAREGMRFTHAYSQPLCTPSRVEIMTGQSNIRNYTAFGVLDPSERTFAHVLRDTGYATAAAGKWQLYGAEHYPEATRAAGTLPAEAGFDEWALWQVRTRSNRYWHPTLAVNGERRSFGETTYGPDVTTDFLLRFIEEHRDEPFFAYYAMNLPHFPFVPTPHSERRDQEGRQENFEDMVAYMDHLVGRIVDHVDSLGLSEETLILFTSDNGTHRSLQSRLNGRVRSGGKWTTTEAGMRVPLVARMPGTVPANTVNRDLIGFSDVLPTLAAFAGAELPDEPIDGRSFAPQLRGEPGTPREWLFSYYWPKPVQEPDEFPDRRFAWTQNYKLYGDGRLYRMADDPRTTEPIELGAGDAEARAARRTLREALRSMPTEPQALMRPDSSAKE